MEVILVPRHLDWYNNANTSCMEYIYLNFKLFNDFWLTVNNYKESNQKSWKNIQ